MEGIKGTLELRLGEKIGLFYVKDKIADTRISGYLEFPTEAHACIAFCDYINNIQDQTKIENIDCYQLILMAAIDGYEKMETLDNLVICDGSNCKEMCNLYIDGYKDMYEV